MVRRSGFVVQTRPANPSFLKDLFRASVFLSMKMSALLFQSVQLVKQSFAAAKAAVARWSRSLFGDLSWNRPGWVVRTQESWRQIRQRRPALVGWSIIAVFLLSCAGADTWNWYQHRPRPRRVSVRIMPIAVTKLQKELRFSPLVLYFSEPAARLEDLSKRTLAGVQLDPPIPGSWHWASGDALLFEPTEDWPADRRLRIVFDKHFFPRHILMERLAYEVRTPPFTISLKQFELYSDPLNPSQRQLTATLELSHPAELNEIAAHLELQAVGRSVVFPSGDPEPHFTLSYGLHHRLIYLRSSQVALPPEEDFMKLKLTKGCRSADGAQSASVVERKTRIPSLETMFRIDSVEGALTRNQHGEPEQLLVVTTTADISTRALAASMDVWLLPKRAVPEDANPNDTIEEEAADEQSQTDDDDENTTTSDWNADADGEPTEDAGVTELRDEEQWKSAADVPEEILSAAKRIEITPVPSEKPQDRQHAFRIRVESDGELYVRIRKGVRAFGDYPLRADHNAVLPIPLLPREVQIEGSGALLALNGERKLSIRSRALAGVEYEIARVATSQINHLVSQTAGRFEHPQFKVPPYFTEENISRIALEHQPIALENKWSANYSTFDFSEHLQKPSDGGSERGLFFLTARGWDPVKKQSIRSIRDSRFLLITDIGIVVKNNADQSHDLFLISIKNGTPTAGTTVDLLGKNGVPILSTKTDDQGHCAFAAVEKSNREKSPVAFVARNGEDVAFIPYHRQDRILNFSRFDIEGAENVLPENLDAFVFSERGVYRPGDEIHAGLIVKQRNWQGNLNGLPLETEVRDARDLPVQTRKVSLSDAGFIEFGYQTAYESPTGVYTLNVYLVKNSKRSTLLGSTTVTVKEFLPDRLRIQSRLSSGVVHGWVAPSEMRSSISLANLYGTPATERRVTAKLILCPTAFGFPELPDFVFYDPLSEKKQKRHAESIDLGEKQTDNNGQTEFDLQLERFADSTYAMRFVAEGFEGEGGRSVTTETSALVSALPYVVGCKADGDLNYIVLQKPHALQFIAVNPQLERIALENVTLNIIAQEYVSVLSKQDNGNYAYQSVLRERTIKAEKISISAAGLRYQLPTDEPGDYICELRDDQNRRLSKTAFCVVGRGRVARALDKHAELEVKLDRPQYNSGDDIAISITAPYAGSGLITIERDKVYTYRWFQTNSASSIQHITVPADFEGSGYINVAFVRAIDSREIFVSPLSYGVVPFTANIERRRLKLEIDAPVKAIPGQPLHIRYRADRPCKMVLFAVDEGILQVTDYVTPDPLQFFFRKCALRVETSQIVDLIIPEFSLLRSLSAFGGGGDVQHLNPFKRVTDKPVVFWSGIIQTDTVMHEAIYDVPDFFDGTLKIMAVAVANEASGSAEREALIRGPFVITPSVPTLAAPGDEFEAGVTVANNVEGSGDQSDIQIRVETNDRILPVHGISQTLRVAEGREQTTSFRFRVANKLGSGEIKFTVRSGKKQISRRATLSVRPPVPYLTGVRGGTLKQRATEIAIDRTMHPEFRKLQATVSALPLGLAHGLDVYLKDFPHGCSEQITSGAFCRLLLADEIDFGLNRSDVDKQLEHTFEVLRRRQNDQGAFGYWAPEKGDKINFISAYVMDFLTESRAAGFSPPPEMFATGLRNLQKMVALEPGNLSDARTLGYAIYVLTREGVITTNYILNVSDYLQKHHRNDWKNDITGVYLAGALHLLHKDSEAEKLIACYRLDDSPRRASDDFYQSLGTDSQFIAVLAREFPARLKQIDAKQFERIVGPVGSGEFNTLSAAYAVRALKAYSHAVSQNMPTLSIVELNGEKQEKQIASGTKPLQRAAFSGDAKALRFQSAAPLSGPGAFFQVVEAGFDRDLPEKPLANGLEIYRELLDGKSKAIERTSLGEPVWLRLHVRSLQHRPATNVAIVDLLPGGFEVIGSSVQHGPLPTRGIDYVDVREDRVVFYATVPVQGLEIDYKIKSCNRGEFVVPPVFAESMYDRNVKGQGVAGKITVVK